MMAQALAEAGADVVITSRSAEAAEKSAAELADYTGQNIIGHAMDITDEDSVTRVFDMAMEKMDRLDILVNNAGGTIPSDNYELVDRTLDEWQYAVRVNLDGTFLCSRAVARIMLKQGSGSIINIASDASLIGIDRSRYDGMNMKPNTVDYCAVKAGVVGFTRDAAAELSPHGIRVNAVSPGGFERGQKPEFIERYNELTPLRRMGIDGRDLKGIVVLLGSDAGDYITGANISVDGGISVVR
jgi:NAD(P)-dependent dehydrogenase (short-subunit alcohol dehydrogenase family)